ncbi:class I SAM-dependent DNA methyltransferase [Ectobacillus polymachus]|uniref:class I SAM-dependent DNA methyltransferase n=1 Tax=Ectobacillus polymachus TaxID=1508806 RepID=UPI003A843E7B
MRYEQFALLYDELMNDIPYEKWIQFVEMKKQEVHVSGKTLLDVGCGTGNIALPLAEKGYDVTGVDLSEEMLTIAQHKLVDFSIPLYQQDMRELELPEKYDIITIFCDSLNYVTDEEGVKQTFARIYHHLQDKGLFLFDVHSLYKIHHIFENETFTINEEQLALIWNCFPGEMKDSIEHELSFFVKEPNDETFVRFEEFHVQRAYEIASLQKWLEEIGFSIVSITDLEMNPVSEKTERIFFAAVK